MLSSTFHKFIDPIGNALGRFAELIHGPVRSISKLVQPESAGLAALGHAGNRAMPGGAE